MRFSMEASKMIQRAPVCRRAPHETKLIVCQLHPCLTQWTACHLTTFLSPPQPNIFHSLQQRYAKTYILRACHVLANECGVPLTLLQPGVWQSPSVHFTLHLTGLPRQRHP